MGYEAHSSEPMHTCIKQLRQIFTFCPVEKTTHNLGYVCKHYYQYVESKELGAKAYADVADKTIDKVLLSHQIWNKQHKYSHHNNLFYSYLIPKMSKWPEIRWRFLAGVSNGEQQQNHLARQIFLESTIVNHTKQCVALLQHQYI